MKSPVRRTIRSPSRVRPSADGTLIHGEPQLRSLLIPVCLIAFGVLAALPFRRISERSAGNLPAADPWAPSAVPRGDAPLVTADTLIERPISPVRFASTPQNSPNPYAPSLGDRVRSYQEVAVPLALPQDEGNVLDAGRPAPPALDRFGIPENLLVGVDKAAQQPAAETRQWQVEQPIPVLEPASALASVMQGEERENEPRKVSKTIAAASKSPTAKIVEPTPEQPAPSHRKRMFIREPAH